MSKVPLNTTVYLDHTCKKNISELLEQDIQAEGNTYARFKKYFLTANVQGDTSALLKQLPSEETATLITNIMYSDCFSVSDYLKWTQTSVVTLDELREAIYKASLNIELMLLCWEKVVNTIIDNNKHIYFKNKLVAKPTADVEYINWGIQLSFDPGYNEEYDMRIPFDIIGNDDKVKTPSQEALWNTIVLFTTVDQTNLLKKCIQEKNNLIIYPDLPFEYYFIIDFSYIEWADSGTYDGQLHTTTLKKFNLKKAFDTLCAEMPKEITSLKKAADAHFE